MGRTMTSLPHIEVASLRGALESIIEAPLGSHTVEVRSLKVQHAAALAEILRFLTSSSSQPWDVQHSRELEVLASADSVLVVLDDALLPLLAEYPTSPAALDVLERYANRLRTLSVDVGGTFEEEIDLLYEGLIRHVNEARSTPLAVSLDELVCRCKSIRVGVTTLRSRMVGLMREGVD